MSIIDIIKSELNKTTTENGDLAYNTSGSFCLDYFGLIGGMRENIEDAIRLFVKAFLEDSTLAIKLLLYTRDIRGGIGERELSRLLYLCVVTLNPQLAIKIMKDFVANGRYDDILCLLNIHNEEVKNNALLLIKEQLMSDLDHYKNKEPYSLLAKWLPSINTSNKVARERAQIICHYLNWNYKEYRQTLSMLREGMIIENNLREKDYTFDYAKVPSKALFVYRQAFLRNDEKRYLKFIEDVRDKLTSMHTGTVEPYEIVHKIANSISGYDKKIKTTLTIDERRILDTTWNEFNHREIDSQTIVVRDGSGSMYASCGIITPNDVATSLALLFAERLKGVFHNYFITFSSKPILLKVKGKDIYEKVINALLADECSNTNIAKVYELIYNLTTKHHIKAEEAIKRIVIISDMEFDFCIEDMSSYQYYKDLFLKAGYTIPHVVFWNVASRSIHLPVNSSEHDVTLISGYSKNIIDIVTNNNEVDPYEFMLKILSKYPNYA